MKEGQKTPQNQYDLNYNYTQMPYTKVNQTSDEKYTLGKKAM